jgi:NAD(P)-dependent dehydrogenase (short-subunit alcohol dehydrogenase family)
MQHLRGKTAFVTGGASGIGLGIVKVLANEGMNVVFTWLRKDQLDEAMAYFAERPHQQVYPIQLDVTDREAYARAADEVQRVFAVPNLLVNNAGVGLRGSMERATYDDWDWVLGVNLGGVVNGIVTFLPRMLATGQEGQIVNVSSMSGIAAIGQVGVYTTSKFAIMGLTEALRTDLANTPIGVSVYCPGTVKSSIAEAFKLRPAKFSRSGFSPPQIVPGAPPHPMMQHAMDPLDAAQHVLRGIRNNELFIMSHAEYRDVMSARHHALMGALPEGTPDAARVESSRSILSNRIYFEAALSREAAEGLASTREVEVLSPHPESGFESARRGVKP